MCCIFSQLTFPFNTKPRRKWTENFHHSEFGSWRKEEEEEEGRRGRKKRNHTGIEMFECRRIAVIFDDIPSIYTMTRLPPPSASLPLLFRISPEFEILKIHRIDMKFSSHVLIFITLLWLWCSMTAVGLTSIYLILTQFNINCDLTQNMYVNTYVWCPGCIQEINHLLLNEMKFRITYKSSFNIDPISQPNTQHSSLSHHRWIDT